MAVRFPFTVSEKQKVLYLDPPPPEELTAFGDRYVEAGLLHDALEFYQVAGNVESLRGLVAKAIENADLLLFLNIFKALAEPPPVEEARKIRERALSLGKNVEAERLETLILSESGK